MYSEHYYMYLKSQQIGETLLYQQKNFLEKQTLKYLTI